MAKKVFLDKRLTPNGKESQIGQDNVLDLNNHVKTLITENPNDASVIPFDNTISGLTATTVEAAINEVYGGKQYIEVDISSAEILAMGTTPIELLPAAGAGNYYNIDTMIFESTGSDYTLANPNQILISCSPYGNGLLEITNTLINDGTNQVFTVNSGSFTQALPLNQAITMGTTTNVDPAGGVGTIKAKIWYTVESFG